MVHKFEHTFNTTYLNQSFKNRLWKNVSRVLERNFFDLHKNKSNKTETG